MVGWGLRVTGKASPSPPTGTPVSSRAWRLVDLLSASLSSCFSKTSAELGLGGLLKHESACGACQELVKTQVLGPRPGSREPEVESAFLTSSRWCRIPGRALLS